MIRTVDNEPGSSRGEFWGGEEVKEDEDKESATVLDKKVSGAFHRVVGLGPFIELLVTLCSINF